MLKQRSLAKTNLALTHFGLGGTGLASMYAPVSREQAMQTLKTAWEKGVRYFDTAPFYGYGLSERMMGDFLRTMPRDAFVLSTKVGRLLKPGNTPSPDDIYFHSGMPFEAVFDYSYEGAMRSIENSLHRLGLNKINIALIHDIDVITHGPEEQPEAFRAAMEGAYKALDALRSQGVIEAVGLGVNEWEVCAEAMEYGDFDCFLLAGRFTLLEQKALDVLLPKCLDRSVSIIIGGVFNSGLLVNPYAERLTYEYRSAPDNIVARAREIDRICKSFQIPLPAAALQYPLRHPAIASILSGARSEKEVSEIIDWMALDIPEVLWSQLTQEQLLVDVV